MIEVWRATCTMCRMVTLLTTEQPKPTECASCLAPVEDVTIGNVVVRDAKGT